MQEMLLVFAGPNFPGTYYVTLIFSTQQVKVCQELVLSRMIL